MTQNMKIHKLYNKTLDQHIYRRFNLKRHHGNTVVAVNWTQVMVIVNGNSVLYNLWQQSSTSWYHMEIWRVRISLLQWTKVQINKGTYLTQQYNILTVLDVSSHYVHYIAQANLILADIYHHAWAPQIRFF